MSERLRATMVHQIAQIKLASREREREGERERVRERERAHHPSESTWVDRVAGFSVCLSLSSLSSALELVPQSFQTSISKSANFQPPLWQST